MGGSSVRRCAWVGVCVLAVTAAHGTAQESPKRSTGSSADERLVVIPESWRETFPFSARFPDTKGSRHLIDLAAVRFATDELVAVGGRRTFRDPDLSTFPPSNVRVSFPGARDRAGATRELFIVQATDAKAQATLRQWLERAGIPILGYVPREAYLVRLDRRAASLVGAQKAVFWMGLYQPAYRVAPELDFILQADPAHELKLRVRLDLETYSAEFQARAALGAVADAKVVDVTRTRQDWVVRVDGPVSLARTFAALPGCLWVERFRDVQLFNNTARTSASVPTGRGAEDGPIMDVEDVWARGIHGEGQVAAAADTGLSTGDNTTADSLHWDFGQAGSATNPMRVVEGYAVNDRGSWDDDYFFGGGHGTHTSGSIVGNGIQSGSDPSTNTFPATSYAGIAPKAGLVFQSLMGLGGFPGAPALTVPGDLKTLFQQAYDAGAKVHSNSWGTGASDYDSLSRDVDEFVWDHPDMVVTFSAGNSGMDGSLDPADGVVDSRSIGSPATAKNAVTVGASENYRPDFAYQTSAADTCAPAGAFDQRAWGWAWPGEFPAEPVSSDKMSDNASGMAAFSSRGPTDDSRIKPDVVAPGAVVASTRNDLNEDFEAWGECEIPPEYELYYVNMGGTSMSNPLVAGAATLVRQYYVDGWHSNWSDVTNASAIPAEGFDPSAAMVKATLINGAWDMAPGQYGALSPQPEVPPAWDRDLGLNLPNDAEGFGRVDVEGSLFPHAGFGKSPARRMDVRDVTAGLVTGGRDTWSYGVGSSSDSLVATLVWTDPFPVLPVGRRLVNDLDLEVTSPSGRRYTANRADAYDTSFVHDTLNNVEQVKVTVPETGEWRVDVVGTAVPGNGVGGTTAQPYALVFSAVKCTVPLQPVGLTAAPNGNNRIDLSWTSTGAPEYHVYRGTSPGGAKSLVGTAVAASFVDAAADAGVTYYYVVKSATGSACESAVSNEAFATATGVCSLAPDFGGLASVTQSSAGSCGLALGWAAAAARCGGAVSYSVYRSTSPGFVPGPANRIQAGLATTSFTDTSGLAAWMSYYYVVRATDEGNGVEDANTVERGATPGEASPLYGPEHFDGLADGDYAGWSVGYFEGSALDWRGVQTCAAHSPDKVFRFGGLGCLDLYASASGARSHSFAQPPAIPVPAGSTNVRLSFWHRWSFERNYDGAYLAVSLDGTTYTNVPTSAMLSGPYNGVNFGTLGPVTVWDDDQPDFVDTVVDLDAACDAVAGNTGGCAGKTVRVAFVTVVDYSENRAGWFVDDVQVTAFTPDSCSTAPERAAFFTARSTSGTNLLEWRNPASGGYGSAVVRYRTDGTFPTSAGDGAAVDCPGQDTALGAYNSCTHSGLTDGTTYSYALFVDNGAGVYSSSRTVRGMPFDSSGAHKWAYATGAASLAPPGVSPGAVGAGAVFALSNDRALHAMNPTAAGGSWPRSGAFSWTPASMDGPAQHRPGVVPMAAGQRIFLASQDGYAYAVDAATGAVAWTSAKLGDVLQANPAGLFSDLRAGAPNLLFVGTRNATSPNTLYALDPNTGETKAAFVNAGFGAIGIVTGIAVDYGSNSVFFTSRSSPAGSSDTLWCLDASSGSLTKKWSLGLGDIDGSPVLHLGRVYVGTNAGEVKAVDPAVPGVKWTYSAGDGPVKGYVFPQFGSTPLRLFFSATTRVWAVDAGDTSAALAWSAPVANPSTPLFVIGSTDLLVGSSNGTLYQLSTGSGAVTGQVDLGTGGLGSPARDAVNELVHVGSTGGVVHTLTLPLPAP